MFFRLFWYKLHFPLPLIHFLTAIFKKNASFVLTSQPRSICRNNLMPLISNAGKISVILQMLCYLKNYVKIKRLLSNGVNLQHFTKGVKFLGVIIKPHRIYIANRTKGNFYNAIEKQNKIARHHKPTKEEQAIFLSILNSYLGILNPCKNTFPRVSFKTYNLRKLMLRKHLSGWWENYFTPQAMQKWWQSRRLWARVAILSFQSRLQSQSNQW